MLSKIPRPARLAVLSLLLLPAASAAASDPQPPQDLFSVPLGMLGGEQSDTAVDFESRYARVEWARTPSFEPPYVVSQISWRGDTIFSARVNDVWFAIATDFRGGSRLHVRSAGGGAFSLRVRYRRPASAWGLAAGVSAVLLAGGAWATWYFSRRRSRDLERTRRELEECAERQTRKFDFVTVLFTDIEGFTRIASRMDPDRLIDELDRCFIHFDEIVAKYNIEKIKTIGDAYMCAGGVPEIDSANPVEVVLAGLEMVAYVRERRAKDEDFWNIRIGINTGMVISGHLGSIKRVFDIWGDTVNTASRMESGGEPGRVNISESTYQRVRDFFECEYRGKMPVKYKGEVDMYFVNRLKEEYRLPGSDIAPNARLQLKLQTLRTQDFEQTVRRRVIDGAPVNVGRRMEDFLTRVRTLAHMEGFTDDETLISGVAALFCFVRVNFPKAVELTGVTEADAIMSRMHLPVAMRNEVSRILLHTETNRSPQSRVEEVISDAFNEIFGRKDMVPMLLALRKEHPPVGIKRRVAWVSHWRKRLEGFTFYTDSARNLCEVPKASQLATFDEALGSFN